MSEIQEIPIENIKVGEHDQRLEIDDESLDGLVSSISRLGLLYPCVVVSHDDKFTLVEGHRRLAACKRLGKQTISCLVKDSEKASAAEIAFAGNFFRKDLSPVELAAALNDVFKSGSMTIEQIAKGFHRSEHWVHSMIAICGWPADVQQAMHVHGMSIAAAANLALVTDDTYRDFLLRNAVEGGVSARTTAAWLQAWRSMQPAEQAIISEPVDGRSSPPPAVPQAPCFVCTNVFPVNMMSHVPMCSGCIKTIRQVM